MTSTKFGYQFIGKPPESYRALCGGTKGIKIVGNETDLTQLRDWNVEIKQARLIDGEERIRALIENTAIADIRTLARQIAAEYAAAASRLNVAGVWWEIPYIMPEVSAKTCAWYPAAAEEFRAVGLRSVPWGFATGTPQTAPWANATSPDEWPQLYDGLARLHALGPEWVRLGVEEYVTDGRLIPGDYSNCGRIAEVYSRHIKPHGWNIVFRGIEAGYDIPGMRDAGITPHNVLTGRNEGADGTGGLADADARYASMPFVDCMYLYQVSDPGVVTKEAAFAFTPGDKNGPGYLDTMQEYFRVNPPVPFVPPAGGGGGTPPVDPPVDPPTQPPTARTLFNMQPLRYDPPADSRHFFPGDTYGDRWCPLDANGNKLFFYGWNEPSDKISHVEPFPPTGTSFPAPVALRVQNQAPKINFWFGVTLDTTPGEVLTITLGSGAEIIGAPGDVVRRITVDLAGGQSPTTTFSELVGQGYALGTLTVTATGPRTTVMAQTRCSVPARVNVDYDVFLVRSNVATTPPTEPPVSGLVPSVVVNGELNQRVGPSSSAALKGVLQPGAYVLAKYPAVNSYVEAVGQGYWVYIGSGRLKAI